MGPSGSQRPDEEHKIEVETSSSRILHPDEFGKIGTNNDPKTESNLVKKLRKLTIKSKKKKLNKEPTRRSCCATDQVIYEPDSSDPKDKKNKRGKSKSKKVTK